MQRTLAAAIALLVLSSAALAQNNFGAQAVGTSASLTVQVTAQIPGTVATVEVLTMGAGGLDFQAGSGGTCADADLAASPTCSQPVTFDPAFPGARLGAVVLLDASNDVLGTAYLNGVGGGGLGLLIPGNMTNYAGDGDFKDIDVGDGLQAVNAELYLPSAMVLDGVGNLYIADTIHNRIRIVCAGTATTIHGTTCSAAGLIETVADTTGANGYTGDNQLASSPNVTLSAPSGIAIDGAGNLYIADTGNNVIREINAATGIITTVAGNGNQGSGGNGGLATLATLNQPTGIVLDPAGDILIADTQNNTIRAVCAGTSTNFGVACPAAGYIVAIAGTGAQGSGGDGGQALSATFDGPSAIAFDPAWNLSIADSGNSKIRAICASASGSLLGQSCSSVGVINTVAGTGKSEFSGDGGPATAAAINSPNGVVFDPAGNLYIGDTQNYRIRKVSGATGKIGTIAGTGEGGFGGNGGPANQAILDGPFGLAMDRNGNLFIADHLNNLIREIQGNLAIVTFTNPVRQGGDSPPVNITVENDGSAPLTLATIVAGVNSATDSAATTCQPSASLPVDNACVVGAVFAPAATPPLTANQSETGNIDVNDDVVPSTAAADSPLVIEVNGTAEPVNATTVAVTGNPNPSLFSQPVTFTATVTTGSGTGNLTGTVSFLDGAKTLQAGVQLNGGTASFPISSLAVGDHTITAVYSGDTQHFGNTSEPITQEIDEGTAVALTSSQDPSPLNSPVTFTATVTAPNGGGVTPDGTVSFNDGANTLATVQINAGGVATFQTSTLAQGEHSFVAAYSGDKANFIAAGTSATYGQDVQAGSTVVVAPNNNPSTYGQPVTFTATVSANGAVVPAGTVNFFDGTTQICTETLTTQGATGVAACITSSLAVGLHSITAQYLGNQNNGPATSGAVGQTVNQTLTGTALVAAPSPGNAGSPVTLTATVTITGGTAALTGTVTFNDGTTPIGQPVTLGAGGVAAIAPILTPGTHVLTAVYSGDANDKGSTSPQVSEAVNLTQTSTALVAAPSPGIAGSPVTLTATVTIVSGKASLAGTVTFNDGPNQIGQPVTLAAGGVVSIAPTLVPGTHVLTAVYSGNANVNGSTAPQVSEIVSLATTQVALTSPTGSSAVVQTSVSFKAVVTGTGVTPTGPVTFNVDGAVAGQATLDATGTAAFSTSTLAVGTHSVTAAYGGDVDNAASTSTPFSIVVTAIPTVTALGAAASGGQAVLVASTLSQSSGAPVPTGTINFNNGTTLVGSATLDSSGVATLTPNLPPGNYSIVAAYLGDPLHSPSTSQPVAVSGTPAGFSIAVTPSTLSLTSGQNGTVTVTLASQSGFTDTVGMGCLTLPASVNCHFSSATVTLASNSTQTVQLTIDTNAPLSGGQSASNARPGSLALAGVILPPGLLFGFLLWRFRRRHAAALLVALVMILAGSLSVTGCTASFSQVSAAPGTYTMQIGGIGSSSNTSHYQNFTLTVTK